MAKIGLNLAVRGICCQILEFLLANAVSSMNFQGVLEVALRKFCDFFSDSS